MRFGGHETFVVRHGWLPKGLALFDTYPERFLSSEMADWLGVGQNMGKSIRHWLTTTGLLTANKNNNAHAKLTVTPLGQLILAHDPYFLESGTWWALHYHAVTHRKNALAWSWFFNSFNAERFDRALCIERLRRYLETENSRLPSANTLTKDILCLLTSYGQPLPAEQGDPEDSLDCPFRELGLLIHFRDSSTYHLRRDPKDVPPRLVGYMLNAAFEKHNGTRASSHFSVPLRDVLSGFGALGKVLVLNPDALLDTLQAAEAALGDGEITVLGLAGERHVRVRVRPPGDWLRKYYEEARR